MPDVTWFRAIRDGIFKLCFSVNVVASWYEILYERERRSKSGGGGAFQQDTEGENASLFYTCEYETLPGRIGRSAIHSYNNTCTYHRSIGMSPAAVNEDYESVVRSRLYPLKNRKSYRWKYDVGDRVRITMQRQPFRKGYLGDWSEEIFEIAVRLPAVPVTYELRDLAGEVIKGKFNESEIQKELKSDDVRFDVDRVL